MEDYLNKNMNKVKQAAEGNEKAYEDLQDAMAIDTALENTNASTEQATTAINTLRTAMKGLGDDALKAGTVVADGLSQTTNGITANMTSGFESLSSGFNDILSLCGGNVA